MLRLNLYPFSGTNGKKKKADGLFFMRLFFCCFFVVIIGCSTQEKTSNYEPGYSPVEESAKPWVFWYWMHGAINKEAITADLEAMKEAGLGGAYIFPIKDVTNPPLYENSVRTLTPQWWQMVKHAMSEADRLGLKIGMHACDGFTCAGGPWITPEMSMQRVVWSDTVVSGNQLFSSVLPLPEIKENYYKDIVVYAYPAPAGAGESSYDRKPRVTSNTGEDVQYLAEKGNSKQYKSGAGWVQFSFEEPFTCRSLSLVTGWNNYQSNRLIIEVSDDGVNFRFHQRLEAPRHGWEDLEANATHLIKPVTARYFRFVHDPEGSEPGAEDLDDAKWGSTLKIKGIELSGEAKIHQFEGKSAAIWRIAKRTTNESFVSDNCIDQSNLIDITSSITEDGILKWQVPDGKWVILRMGHTSTGKTNYVGGAGLGLECDKLNAVVAKFQFEKWFGEVFQQTGAELATRVLKRFHVDSWECGSQNWSPVLRDEFKKRRGYDLYPYLPVMAGVPVQSAEISERVLADVRMTISELFVDNFYKVMAQQAHNLDCSFSAESVSPVMMSDGMLHFKEVDIPMGEFWLRSPSHDKPNDIFDAISAAHIYGKNIVQSESLTEIRLDWDEHPGMLKPVVDRNFALGINRMFIHVFTLNPWLDRKPGMTLDKVGTYFQRDQTWWKQGRAFVDYITNCQLKLQSGKPVVDIAVFTGEELPRRALLPDRLVDLFPGIMGYERIDQEKLRLKNEGAPLRALPAGVKTQENMADPEEWINPLNGYSYDSFNCDALLNLAKVENGRVVLPGGASYGLLVVPGKTKMSPDGGERMSIQVARKLLELANDGASIMVMDKPVKTIGIEQGTDAEDQLHAIIEELFTGEKMSVKDADGNNMVMWKKGKGLIIQGPYKLNSFDHIGIAKDFQANNQEGIPSKSITWNHRNDNGDDIYFVANQKEQKIILNMTFRAGDKTPLIYDPVTNEIRECNSWKHEDGLVKLTYSFYPYESVFFIFKDSKGKSDGDNQNWIETIPELQIEGEWSVQFDTAFGGPANPVIFTRLSDWTKNNDDGIRFYSGTAVYTKSFQWNSKLKDNEILWIDLGEFANIAEVKLNGKPCGISWTAPYRLRIDKAVREGDNQLEIAVTNTWANRLMGDHDLPENKRITWTTCPYRLDGRSLLPAGLFGPVIISKTK